MGHAVNSERRYRLLQRRLDRQLTGAPDSPTLMKILRLLFSTQEAELARNIPGRLTPVETLARSLEMPTDEVSDRLGAMARRGLILDLEHGGTRYFALAPVVIGFFEFTFMRARDDVPMAELAELFDRYMNESDRFARSVFAGTTQLGRSLVREEALPEGDPTEILDFERASRLIRSASAVGVSLCVCRHAASHRHEACDRPQRCCLSLNYAAESMIRMGTAERIMPAEGLRILRECQDAGLAQTADNVQRKPAYLCNCCGCCCGMIEAIKDYDLRGAIVTSNWIMEVDASKCKGCGKCAEACPVGAIAIEENGAPGKPGRRARCDEGLCLGCGVCHGACRFGGITMKPRPQRVFTPETIFDRVVAMAVERGKLAEMIFDNPEKLSHRALGRVVGVLERSPVFKAAMAVQPIRSALLRSVVAGARKASGDLAAMIE